MKLAVSSWSYHAAFKKRRLTHDQWLAACASINLDGIELLDLHVTKTGEKELSDLRARLENLGLAPACASVSNDFGLPAKPLREASEKKVCQWIDVAAAVGAPVVRVFAGWPGFGTKPFYEREKKKLWGDMIERLRRCAERAAEAGVVLGLENHNHGGFTATVEDLLAILTEVDHSALGVTLDTGDYLVDTGNGYPAIEQAAPHAVHVHAKLYAPDAAGREPTHDWPRILGIFQKSRYDGWVSIEYEGKEDPEQAVPRGVRYLREQLQESARHE